MFRSCSVHDMELVMNPVVGDESMVVFALPR
jgi:hypothetical protein